jgi:cytochrome c-type biogenesis protein CcmH/NrfG
VSFPKRHLSLLVTFFSLASNEISSDGQPTNRLVACGEVSDISRYEALTKQHPDQAEPFYQLGRAYSQAKEWDKSILTLNRALELQPENPDVRLALAYTHMWHYLSQRRLIESGKLFQEVLQTVPNYTDAAVGLKRVKDIRDALNRGEILETSQEETPRETLVQAYKDAIRYEHLTQEHPDQAESFYQLGRAYAHIKSWHKSIRALRRTLELQPNNPDIRLALAYTLLFEYLSKAELIESEELFDLVLFAVPDYKDAQEGLKQLKPLLHSQSKEKHAVQSSPTSQEEQAAAIPSSQEEAVVIARYETLIQQYPDESEYFYQLGRAYSRTQEWEKSISALNHALELKADNQDARLALAYAYLQRYTSRSNLLKSKHLFQQVLQTTSHYVDAQDGLKQVENLLDPPPIKEEGSEKEKSFHFLQRQPSESPSALDNSTIQQLSNVSYYELFTQEHPDQPGGFYQLGRAYSQAQQWNPAITAFNRALELQPNNQDACLALAYALLFEYRSKQDLIESERLFKQVLAAIPSYRDAQVGLTQVECFLRPVQEETTIEKKN